MAYRSLEYSRKMTLLHKLLNDPDHGLMSEYTFELRFCGKQICGLCPPHQIQTLMTPFQKLQRRVLNFMTLTVVDLDNKENFQYLEYERKRVDEVLIRSEQLKSLQILNKFDAEKKLLKESKVKDKVNLKGMLHYPKA